MSRRDIFNKTVRHEQPGVVLVDMGKHIGSIHRFAYQKLREYLKDQVLLSDPAPILDRMAQTVRIDEALLRHFDIDFRWLHPNINAGMTDVAQDKYQDMWGVTFRNIGDYWCVHESPLADIEDASELAAYNWLDIDRLDLFAGLREEAKKLHEETDYVIGADGLKNGILMTALQMRGYEQLFVDMMVEPDLANDLFDRILTLIKDMWTRYLKEVGPYIQLLYLTDDYGTQNSMLVSPEMFREFIQPRNKDLIDHIRSLTDARVMFHSDGSILPIIGDLADSGVDILNPVQTSTEGLHDTQALKQMFGERISFHGAIDVQKVLPNLSPAEIAEEVKRRMDDLSVNGGYICAACHNIGHDIPPENIVAFYEATKKYKNRLK